MMIIIIMIKKKERKKKEVQQIECLPPTGWDSTGALWEKGVRFRLPVVNKIKRGNKSVCERERETGKDLAMRICAGITQRQGETKVVRTARATLIRLYRNVVGKRKSWRELAISRERKKGELWKSNIQNCRPWQYQWMQLDFFLLFSFLSSIFFLSVFLFSFFCFW